MKKNIINMEKLMQRFTLLYNNIGNETVKVNNRNLSYLLGFKTTSSNLDKYIKLLVDNKLINIKRKNSGKYTSVENVITITHNKELEEQYDYILKDKQFNKHIDYKLISVIENDKIDLIYDKLKKILKDKSLNTNYTHLSKLFGYKRANTNLKEAILTLYDKNKINISKSVYPNFYISINNTSIISTKIIDNNEINNKKVSLFKDVDLNNQQTLIKDMTQKTKNDLNNIKEKIDIKKHDVSFNKELVDDLNNKVNNIKNDDNFNNINNIMEKLNNCIKTLKSENIKLKHDNVKLTYENNQLKLKQNEIDKKQKNLIQAYKSLIQ